MKSPPVHLAELVFGWHFGPSGILIAAAQVLIAVLYLRRVATLAKRGRKWSKWRTASFVSGLAVIVFAVDSGIAHYEDSVFTVHVIQHLLLMNTAPPLLALGAPVTLLLQTSQRKTKTVLLRLLHSRLARIAANPVVGFSLSMGTMYVYFLTSFYPATLRDPLLHDLTHIIFLAVGCAYWWPVVSADPIPRRLGFGARMGMVLAAIPFNAFLGIAIMNMSHPISPAHTLSDTHAGGGLLWGLGEIFTLAALGVLFVGWSKEEERKAVREDRRQDALIATPPDTSRSW